MLLHVDGDAVFSAVDVSGSGSLMSGNLLSMFANNNHRRRSRATDSLSFDDASPRSSCDTASDSSVHSPLSADQLGLNSNACLVHAFAISLCLLVHSLRNRCRWKISKSPITISGADSVGMGATFAMARTRNWPNCTDRHEVLTKTTNCSLLVEPKSGGTKKFSRACAPHFQIRSSAAVYGSNVSATESVADIKTSF